LKQNQEAVEALEGTVNPALWDEKTYRAHDAIAASDLRLMAKSYGHYLHRQEYPGDYPYSAALRAGTIVHAAVLEPERFAEEFVVPPEVNKRTKAGKEEWEKWEEEHKDVFAITQDEMTKANILRDHVFKNPKAAELFTGGIAEVPLLWNSEHHGTEFRFKGRADYVVAFGDTMLVVDLKTTQDASYTSFQRSMVNWDYALQAAHYRDGVAQIMPEYDVHFVWVVIEKAPPMGCQIFSATEEIYEYGRKLKEKGLKNLLAGDADPEGLHLPYPTAIKSMELPRWVNRNV
jgi:ATP-dependent exoDNAse (exonuclease V) beta subunit